MEPAVKIPKQKIPPHPQGNQSPCWPLRDRLIHPLLQVYLQACSECTLRALGSPWKPTLFPRAAGSVSDTRSLNGVVVCFLLQISQLLRPTEVRGQKWRLNGRPSSFRHCSWSGPKNRAAGSLQELEPELSPLQAHPHTPFMQACVVNGLGYSEEETAPQTWVLSSSCQ